jgi:hypothetical protein
MWNRSNEKLLAADTSLGLGYKRDESFNLRNPWQLYGNFLERILGSESGLKNNPVGLADDIDDASVEAAAFQAFEVQAVQFGTIAGRITVRRHVL